jgi:hypothetical protein
MFNRAANIFQKKASLPRFSTSRQIILAAFCDEACLEEARSPET